MATRRGQSEKPSSPPAYDELIAHLRERDQALHRKVEGQLTEILRLVVSRLDEADQRIARLEEASAADRKFIVSELSAIRNTQGEAREVAAKGLETIEADIATNVREHQGEETKATTAFFAGGLAKSAFLQTGAGRVVGVSAIVAAVGVILDIFPKIARLIADLWSQILSAGIPPPGS